MTPDEAERHKALETTLPRAGISYIWLRALGGRRRKLREDSPHTALHSDAFRNYADYMLTAEFHHAVNELICMAGQSVVCVMCAEAQVYWHCHRMLLSDYLAAQDHTVLHIADAGPAKQHRMTPEARVADGNVIYDGGMLFQARHET
jgi:uncharacterized protein (DUF488 family)